MINLFNYYFNEFRLWNNFDLNENNKNIILNNDEYSDEYRFGSHSNKQRIMMDILKIIVIIYGY